MINPADRHTKPLPLDEQPAKPRRGRPATGQALSNAERQRLYRERQKAQRNEKPDSYKVPFEEVVEIAQELGERCKAAEAKLQMELERGEKARKRIKELEAQLAQRNENMHKAVAEDLRAELQIAIERIEQLERANRNLQKDLEMKNGQIKALSNRVESAETELSLRDGNKLYYVERCSKGKRTWKKIGDGNAMTREIAELVMSDLSAAPINMGDRFRIVPKSQG